MTQKGNLQLQLKISKIRSSITWSAHYVHGEWLDRNPRQDFQIMAMNGLANLLCIYIHSRVHCLRFFMIAFFPLSFALRLQKWNWNVKFLIQLGQWTLSCPTRIHWGPQNSSTEPITRNDGGHSEFKEPANLSIPNWLVKSSVFLVDLHTFKPIIFDNAKGDLVKWSSTGDPFQAKLRMSTTVKWTVCP